MSPAGEKQLVTPAGAKGTTRPPLLPVPAVIVVGSFSGDEAHFAKKAWSRVCSAYTGEDVPEGKSPRQPSEKTHPDRADAPRLFPLQLDDEGNTRALEFASSLHTMLCKYDVWAIIASTTSQNTPGLLEALEAVDVPVFLTVDSAMGGITRTPNVLRLMPNNEHQAQAIVAKVKDLLATNDTVDDWTGVADVYFHPAGDRYVSDLLDAIMAQVELGPHQPRLRPSSDVTTLVSNPVLVCVGYKAAVASLTERLKQFQHLVMSDGCHDLTIDQLGLAESTPKLFCAHAAFETSGYAHDAYRATCAMWIEFGRPESPSVAIGISPALKLKPFVHLVREHLERTFPTRYLFDGLDNRRGGYVVDRLGRANGGAPRSSTRPSQPPTADSI